MTDAERLLDAIHHGARALDGLSEMVIGEARTRAMLHARALREHAHDLKKLTALIGDWALEATTRDWPGDGEEALAIRRIAQRLEPEEAP